MKYWVVGKTRVGAIVGVVCVGLLSSNRALFLSPVALTYDSRSTSPYYRVYLRTRSNRLYAYNALRDDRVLSRVIKMSRKTCRPCRSQAGGLVQGFDL
ncbi:unnamed protein product, partial [Trichogramma brassicae]